MSGLNRLKNTILETLGFDEWGSRQVIPENIESEITEGEQVFTDFSIPGNKIHKLKVDQLIAGSILTEEYIQSSGFVDGVSGWQIKGNGDATFANVVLTGGVFKYGKTSPTDTTLGYWFGPDSGDVRFVIGDPYKQVDWNVSETNQFSVKKAAASTVGNALNVQDLSSDGNASINVQYYGDNSSKDLLRLELNSTQTEARACFTAIKEGGIALALGIFDNEDGDIDDIIYARNQYSQGQVGFFHQDHASNQEPVLVIRSDGAISTNFYRLINLDGNATPNLDIYIANNASPHGTLSGGIGDICFSTNGTAYICTANGTTWKEMGGGYTVLASASQIAWADTQRTENSLTYVKKKEILVKAAGTYRVTHRMQRNGGSYNAYSRIYVNGVAVGTERATTSTSYVDYSEDITVNGGDLIQLYAKVDDAGIQSQVEWFRLGAAVVPATTVNLD
jgi:hypothetical protein